MASIPDKPSTTRAACKPSCKRPSRLRKEALHRAADGLEDGEGEPEKPVFKTHSDEGARSGGGTRAGLHGTLKGGNVHDEHR